MNYGARTRLLYSQDQLPVFQNRMYDTAEEAKNCPKGDIQLVENLQTGLVYNQAYRPELVEYDSSYQNEQAVSPLFCEHLELVAEIIERCMGRHAIVEVGCGKAFFLEMLLDRKIDIIGFDPTYEGSNSRVLKRYFDPAAGIKANGLVLRHVLEHIQNPFNFLLQLKQANGGRGKIYIEVPCFDWICKHRAWFDIYYEHVNYFRLNDFHRMFGSIIESGHLFGDQYLYVVANLESLQEPERCPEYNFNFPADFMDKLQNHVSSEKTVIWGGASKGVIFALYKERSGQRIDYVIDINPSKQGKFLPSTGLLVQSPSEVLPELPSGVTIYVMNSNYMDEIKKMSDFAFTYIGVDHD